jgi:hypothetical protein
MNEKKLSGCGLAAILLAGGLVVILGLIILATVRWQTSRESRRGQAEVDRAGAIAFASQSDDKEESVVLDRDSFGRYSPAEFGSGLTREHFVALMADQNATELARQTFTRNASGQVVRWLLKTGDVKAAGESGLLVAEFGLPYRIQSGPNSWSGSSLTIRAEFPAAERDRLLALRRNDWVTVEGRLQLEQAEIKLLDARIPLPTDAEAPTQ